MQRSECMKACASFHSLSFKGHVKLFLCWPVIFKMFLWMCLICTVIAKNKYLSWRTVTSGQGIVLCPNSPSTGVIFACLFHQKLIDKVGWHYHNPLGLSVNLWTTGTDVWQCVLSVHCVQCVSLMSSVSLSFVTPRRNIFVFRLTCIKVRVQYQFFDVSFSKVLLCGHTQCTWKQQSHHTTKPSVYESPSVTKHYLHYLTWHYFIAVMGNGQNCWVQDRHNMKLQYTNIHTNPYSRMKEICVWSHTALTSSISVVWGPFLPQWFEEGLWPLR